MTMGEIDAALWARMRHKRPEQDAMAEMYQDLQKLKGRS